MNKRNLIRVEHVANEALAVLANWLEEFKVKTFGMEDQKLMTEAVKIDESFSLLDKDLECSLCEISRRFVKPRAYSIARAMRNMPAPCGLLVFTPPQINQPDIYSCVVSDDQAGLALRLISARDPLNETYELKLTVITSPA